MNKHTEKQVYHLSPEDEGATVAAALKSHREASWGEVRKLLSSRRVQVNGNLCLDEARRVKESDVVVVLATPLPKPIDATDLRIAHLDDHLLIVQKPAGITSVRSQAEKRLSTRRRQLQPTVEELLPKVLARIQRINWPPVPPKGKRIGRMQAGRRKQINRVKVARADFLPKELQVQAVHRLDRDTSGLMIFARTQQAASGLVALFKKHAIDRQYVAICHGHIEKQTIESFLIRDRGDGLRGSTDDADASNRKDALRAVTHIVDAVPFTGADEQPYTRVRCKLETGRTHQIRIHLSEAGHPICGESLYTSDQTIAATSGSAVKFAAPRQALHSDRLQFTHPVTREAIDLHMQLPQDLARWIKHLRPDSK